MVTATTPGIGWILQRGRGTTVFSSVLEYPLALVGVVAVLGLRETRRPRHRILDMVLPVALAVILLVTASILMADGVLTEKLARLPVFLLLGGGGVAIFSFRARPIRFALGLAAILAIGQWINRHEQHTRFAARSFYNVYRVVDDGDFRVLYSGTTIHGIESAADSGRVPLAYYHRESPIGALLEARAWHPGPWRVGTVGLGAGALAAYARPGDSWTFFEIDPLVEQIARDARFFRYLDRALATPRVVLGDARLSLEREPATSFDVLVIDAFSSDAIPTHLLTREALALYESRLARDGVIAWHISNKYLDLQPVLNSLAREANLPSFVWDDRTSYDTATARFRSVWVAMTTSSSTAAAITANPRWRTVQNGRRSRLWTDDFSNVLSVLR